MGNSLKKYFIDKSNSYNLDLHFKDRSNKLIIRHNKEIILKISCYKDFIHLDIIGTGQDIFNKKLPNSTKLYKNNEIDKYINILKKDIDTRIDNKKTSSTDVIL